MNSARSTIAADMPRHLPFRATAPADSPTQDYLKVITVEEYDSRGKTLKRWTRVGAAQCLGPFLAPYFHWPQSSSVSPVSVRALTVDLSFVLRSVKTGGFCRGVQGRIHRGPEIKCDVP
jgi:hypothetical protein